MRLILVRHGETEHNAGGITLGRADIPLNERGRAQAQALASPDTRVRLLVDAPPIEAVYSSPLRRAFDTASPLATALGIVAKPEAALVEMDVGEVEGIAYTEVRKRHPEFLSQWFSEDVATVRMPGGETLREVQDRSWKAVLGFAAQHDKATVVAVTHNFVILTLLCRSMNLSLAKFRGLRQDLAAVSVIEITNAVTRVLVLNDRCHLPTAG